MTKKSTEREISIKASVDEAGATFRGNVELLTDAKQAPGSSRHFLSKNSGFEDPKFG